MLENPSPNGMFDQCPLFVTCSAATIEHSAALRGHERMMAAAMPDSPAALLGELPSATDADASQLAELARAPEVLDAATLVTMGEVLPVNKRCVGCWVTGLEAEIVERQIASLPETGEPPIS
jgi:hypothetical protein